MCYSPMPISEIEATVVSFLKGIGEVSAREEVALPSGCHGVRLKTVVKQKGLFKAATVNGTLIIEADTADRPGNETEGALIDVTFEGSGTPAARAYTGLLAALRSRSVCVYVEASPDLAQKHLGRTPPEGKRAWVKYPPL
jgi:hypothetical protein